MLWVDKYRPTDLKKMDYHADLSSRLVELAKDGDLPHLLFYGPSGAGKKTRIAALLKALYGTGAAKQRLEYREFKTPTNKLIEVTTVASNYHIEMNPGDAGNNDRFVVQEVIKEIAQSASLHAKTGRVAYKVILLVEVDRLTRQAQAALRRTMEKCTSSCRLILCCNNPSKVIDPLRSRCLGIRVGAPTEAEIVSVLHSVADKEGVQLPVPLAARIASQSKRNLRRAILSLEACHAQSYPFSPEQAIDAPDWETYIVSMANDILREQSPQRLLATREKLYELLVKCIPADVIIKTLTRELLKNLDDELKTEVLHWAAVYEHRIQLGSKEIFHLEAFVAKFMALYKRFIVSMFD
ncbi:P-loop containing nucleoside triphosphate hydrolase protein [Pelagophyceae sp. CCMP2097]|nr:P-loop containing nucleoside triphosphate hydrolase protein [Pelagophyceae sp. CCMP2097]